MHKNQRPCADAAIFILRWIKCVSGINPHHKSTKSKLPAVSSRPRQIAASFHPTAKKKLTVNDAAYFCTVYGK